MNIIISYNTTLIIKATFFITINNKTKKVKVPILAIEVCIDPNFWSIYLGIKVIHLSEHLIQQPSIM